MMGFFVNKFTIIRTPNLVLNTISTKSKSIKHNPTTPIQHIDFQ